MEWTNQYKHPLWQRKRLEALEDAEFTCSMCGSDEATLHVHHKRYVKGRKMWEYNISELAVLCDECHKYAHEINSQIDTIFSRIHPDGMGEILSLLIGFCGNCHGPASANLNDLEYINPHAYAVGELAAEAICQRFENINLLTKVVRDENAKQNP